MTQQVVYNKNGKGLFLDQEGIDSILIDPELTPIVDPDHIALINYQKKSTVNRSFPIPGTGTDDFGDSNLLNRSNKTLIYYIKHFPAETSSKFSPTIIDVPEGHVAKIILDNGRERIIFEEE